tara:strand:- start:6555 stop:6932 length:378 start_codon:yes stop_codon:yes gene_type:complete
MANMFDLMKYKTDQWETLKDHRDKCIIVGRLEMLKDLNDYFDGMRESYTRLLVINGVEEKEYDDLKSRHRNVKGLDGSADECDEDEKHIGSSSGDEKKIDMKIIDSNEEYNIVDRDGDSLSFDNC